MFPSDNESYCQSSCEKMAECSYYTITTYNSLTPQTCILLSHSTELLPCEGCRTGPKKCDFSRQCKQNEAVIESSPPRNFAVESTNGTLQVETMGCSAQANVLLIGGGGTGGRDSETSTKYNGGGGSGYINYGIIDIPYSVGFRIEIGRGGHRYGDINSTYSPLDGQSTSVFNETGSLLLTAQGGKQGEEWTGGDGYSGGGADQAVGGMDGGNGGSTSNYTGGSGSGFDISSVQQLFSQLELLPAQVSSQKN
ncbi:uncharacterized protein LOC142345529 isoform X2 [Convolutriloba macropyga]|uniref:uncharacterized protein LOC142345529 isoform X2 n=1 Tax=Convolutriloba macropyga TaxID=536237 RepID=UPI003F523B47